MKSFITVLLLTLTACGGPSAQAPKPQHQSQTWRRNQAALARAWEAEMREDHWRDAQRIRAMLEGADELFACWYVAPEERVCNPIRMHNHVPAKDLESF